MKILFDLFPAVLVAAAPGLLEDLDQIRVVPPTEKAFMVDKCRIVVDEDLIIVAVDSPEGADHISRRI